MRMCKSDSSPVDRYHGPGSKMCRTAWQIGGIRGAASATPVIRRRSARAAAAGGGTRERRLDHPEEAHPNHQHADPPMKHCCALPPSGPAGPASRGLSSTISSHESTEPVRRCGAAQRPALRRHGCAPSAIESRAAEIASAPQALVDDGTAIRNPTTERM